MIQKRFPANTSMDLATFLNDRKVDAELYSLFQEYSRPDEEKRTVVSKKDLPVQAEMCRKLGIKSPKTFREHRDYLIDQGYIIDEKSVYILPNREEIFFMMPLKTVQFLNDTLRDQIIKIYLYLGQRWKYKKGKSEYEFTEQEIANHIGVKTSGNPRGYMTVRNGLLCLQKLGLIDYVSFYDNVDGKPVPKMRLVEFSLEIK